ncbi:unnamed protein product [Notodromas monacha]|uniref:RCR-type E3 ubiquitin transferase n=1 Tax=Notodromas monacha TaxID=399045 RepID=A0A7R9G9C8_9CRUS|nr:unnamed protein product [Notodromas monacha]CAG0913072.1 unnamed protein product [Notodromas monacha]
MIGEMNDLAVLSLVQKWEDADDPLAPVTIRQRDVILELSSCSNDRPLPFQKGAMNIDDESSFDNPQSPFSVTDDDDVDDFTLHSTNRRHDSFLALETGRVVIDSAQDFFQWFSKVEEDMEFDQLAAHHKFLLSLKQANAHCNNLLNETTLVLSVLSRLNSAHEAVLDKTKSLHDACENLLQEQEILSKTAESLDSHLSYFEILDELSEKLSAASLSVHSDGFIPTLVKLDECISYMKDHVAFKDAPIYAVRLQACMQRGLSIIQAYVFESLTDAFNQVQPNISSQSGKVDAGSGYSILSLVGAGSGNVSAPTLSLDQAYPFLYARFRVNAPKIKSMVAEIESRLDDRSYAVSIYQDIQSHYFGLRKRLLFPIISALINELKEKHFQNKCAMVRSGCRLLLNVCQDEIDLFACYFSGKETGQLDAFLDELCSLLYDVFRPIFVHVNHLETLTDLCIIMRVDILEDGESKLARNIDAFVRMMTQLIEDVQERLIYRTHMYIKSDILGYVPAGGDLAYPDKLIMIESIAESLHEADSEMGQSSSRAPSVASTGTAQSQFIRSHTGASAADFLGMWYPTVRRTLVCLSKLYRSLDKGSFQGLSQEALSACIESLVNASESIASKQTNAFVDAQLFIIKHLLILREQIAPFQVDFVVKEMMLDFSKMREAAMDLFQSRRVLSLRGPSAILEFILEGTPDIRESVVDSKRDVDLQLKRSCHALISHCTTKIVSSVANLLGRIENFIHSRHPGNRSHFIEVMDIDDREALRKESFMEPENITQSLAEAKRNIKVNIPVILRSLHLYLANRDTEMILFRPIKMRVLNAFEGIEKLMVRLFVEEELKVINCPSQEQLNILLSNLDFENTYVTMSRRGSRMSCIDATKCVEDDDGGLPVVELDPGASSFSVFANVRKKILESQIRKAAQLYFAFNSWRSCDNPPEIFSDASSSVTLPKVVGIGLTQVFLLIKNSRHIYPSLCLQSLEALLKMLEGLPPQGLSEEPANLLNDLFRILRDLAASDASVDQSPSADTELDDGSGWKQSSPPQKTLQSLACACMLSLVVAVGNPGKLFLAVGDILMSVRVQSLQDIFLPRNLIELQRTTCGTLMGNEILPSWISVGVQKSGLCNSFHVGRFIDESDVEDSNTSGDVGRDIPCCIVSNGAFMYIFHAEEGLLKVGTGYQGTIRGHIYMCKPPPFYFEGDPWMGFACGYLCLRHGGRGQNRISLFHPETLKFEGEIELPLSLLSRQSKPSQLSESRCSDDGSCVLFSDGKTLGLFLGSDEEVCYKNSITVRSLDRGSLQKACLKATSESKEVFTATDIRFEDLNLRLVRKCLDVFGHQMNSASDEVRSPMHAVNFVPFPSAAEDNHDDELISVANGKDFTLLCTRGGRVLYAGRSQSLGLKPCGHVANDLNAIGPTGFNQWNELPLSWGEAKPARIVDIAVGHEAEHGLLLTDDGRVFFVGTSKRGEDGEPRLVTDLKHVKIVEVAMGKAHVVAIGSDGALYTFGMNNRGQCGRQQAASATDDSSEAANDFSVEKRAFVNASKRIRNKRPREEVDANVDEFYDRNLENNLEDDECLLEAEVEEDHMHNRSVAVALANLVVQCVEYAVLAIMIVFSVDMSSRIWMMMHHYTKMLLQLIVDGFLNDLVVLVEDGDVFAFGNNSHGELGNGGISSRNMPLKVPFGLCSRESTSDATKTCSATKPKSAFIVQVAAGKSFSAFLEANGQVYVCGLPKDFIFPKETDCLPGYGIRIVGGIGYLTTPSKIPGIGPEFGRKAVWIGASGDQLFVKVDETLINPRTLQNAKIVANADVIALLLDKEKLATGLTKTGRPMLGEPGTAGSDFLAISREKGSCHSGLSDGSSVDFSGCAACLDPHFNIIWRYEKKSGLVEGYNVILSGIRIDNGIDTAELQGWPENDNQQNRSVPLILLPEFMIPMNDCNVESPTFVSRSQAAMFLLAALDTLIRSFTNQMPHCDSNRNHAWNSNMMHDCLSRNQSTLRSHRADYWKKLNNVSFEKGMQKPIQKRLGIHRKGQSQNLSVSMKNASRNGLNIVSRFQKQESGWGYSDNSVEAVRFMCETVISFYGVALYGAAGCYLVKMRLYDIGYDDSEYEGHIVAETEENMYENDCKLHVFFREPVVLMSQRWYVVWIRISGPTSPHGVGGHSPVIGDDGTIFHFKHSYKSNNGTDVLGGQIPEIFYKTKGNESMDILKSADGSDPIYPISSQFLLRLSPECFDALLNILEWSWKTFKAGSMDLMSTPVDACYAVRETLSTRSPSDSVMSSPTSTASASSTSSSSYFFARQGEAFARIAAVQDLQRLVHIACACLRLLRAYVNYMYPTGVPGRTFFRRMSETSWAPSCVFSTRKAIESILADPICSTYSAVPPTNDGITSGFLSASIIASSKKPHHTLCAAILDECLATYSECFHAFYPSTKLKWDLLCNVLGLNMPKEDAPYITDELVCAVFRSLSMPSVRLGYVFPIGTSTICTANADILGSTVRSWGDGHPDPSQALGGITASLVKFMEDKSQLFLCTSDRSWDFSAVINRIVGIVLGPIQRILDEIRLSGGDDRPNEHEESTLVHAAAELLTTFLAQLTSLNVMKEMELSITTKEILSIPSRFGRVSQAKMWNACNGSPDAIGFVVDHPGIIIAGAKVFGSNAMLDYELELLVEKDVSFDENVKLSELRLPQRWLCLETVCGTYRKNDIVDGLADIRFQKPVAIKERMRHVLRLRHHGGYTHSGEAGLSCVKGPDGTTFSFFSVSVSFNGTSLTRGQIPQILYYSEPKQNKSQVEFVSLMEEEWKQTALWVSMRIVDSAAELFEKCLGLPSDAFACGRKILAESSLVTSILPLVFALLLSQTVPDAKICHETLNALKSLLPFVTELNLEFLREWGEKQLLAGKILNQDSSLSVTTSSHYAVVESKHPYEPATVQLYKAVFPPCVQWISLEFDSQCCLGQPEDSLQIFIPVDAENEDQSVEAILSPVTLDGEISDEIFARSSSQTCPPDGFISVLPKFNVQDPETWPRSAIILPGNKVIFSLSSATPYLGNDKQASFYGFKCLLIGHEYPMPSSNDVPCGGTAGTGAFWSDGLLVLEREIAHLAGACCCTILNKKLCLPSSKDVAHIDQEASSPHNEKDSCLPLLSRGLALSHPPTVRDVLDCALPLEVKSNEFNFLMEFVKCAGSLNSSGGRLARWLQPEPYIEPRLCQVIYSRQNIFSGWETQISIITRDQYGQVAQSPNLKVDVQAMPISDEYKDFGGRAYRDKTNWSEVSGAEIPDYSVPYQPTVREKIVFQSITAIKNYENWSFEELRFFRPSEPRPVETMQVKDMSDGSHVATWIPSASCCYAIQVFVDGYLLEGNYSVEVQEVPPGVNVCNEMPVTLKHSAIDAKVGIKSRRFGVAHSAGLRIRSHPTLQSEQVGVIKKGTIIMIVEELQNKDGTWVRLTHDSLRAHCHPDIMEGWSLQYNQHLGKNLLVPVASVRASNPVPGVGFQFDGRTVRCVLNQGDKLMQFEEENYEGAKWAVDPLDPCEQSIQETKRFQKVMHKPALYPKPASISRLAGNRSPKSERKDPSPIGSVDTLSLNSRRCISNGNGFSSPVPTRAPPPTPKRGVGEFARCSRSSSPAGVRKRFREMVGERRGDSTPRDSYLSSEKDRDGCGAQYLELSSSISASAALQESLPRDGSTESDTSAMLSSLSKDASKSASSSSLLLQSAEDSPLSTPSTLMLIDSAEEIHRGLVVNRMTAEVPNDERPSSIKFQEMPSHPPAGPDNIPGVQQFQNASRPLDSHGSGRMAMKPSVAETVRAIFASFIWHEGLVHDAMACASFLKFHPSLSKSSKYSRKEASVDRNVKRRIRVSRTKEEKARLRHSIEVTSALRRAGYKNNGEDILLQLASHWNANKKVADVVEPSMEELLDEPPDTPVVLGDLVAVWERLAVSTSEVISDQVVLPDLVSSESTATRVGGNASSCPLCGARVSSLALHMRKTHPGCGRPAANRVYKSEEISVKWPSGLCGDTGMMRASAGDWYLLCQSCRAGYLMIYQAKRGTQLLSPMSHTVGTEKHRYTLRNALFLLKLNSAADESTPVLARKRINSTGEAFAIHEHGSMLNAPSKHLSRVVASLSSEDFGGEVLEFVSHYHDLDALQNAMKQSVDRATFRAYGLQTLEWFLRNVTQSTCVHELLWFLVKSFTVAQPHPKLKEASVHAENPKTNVAFGNDPAKGVVLRSDGGNFLYPESPVYPDEFMVGGDEPRFQRVMPLRSDRSKVDYRRHDDEQPSFRRSVSRRQLPESTRTPPKPDNLLDHPLSDLHFVARNPLPKKAFHLLMQTIADLMPRLPTNAFELQTISVKCWGFKFLPSDQRFLHRCRVFNHISRILSRYEDSFSKKDVEEPFKIRGNGRKGGCFVGQFVDLTSECLITPATGSMLGGNMTDGSTETFWESEGEDRTRSREIVVELRRKDVNMRSIIPHLLAVHIDNVRDLTCKTGLVAFKCGRSIEQLNCSKVEQLPSRFTGWVTLWIKDWEHSVFKICLMGPDSAVRVRQIRLIGNWNDDSSKFSVESWSFWRSGGDMASKCPAVTIKQGICEAETLRVFRQLVSQIFEELLVEEPSSSMTLSEELLNTSFDGVNRVRCRSILGEHVSNVGEDERHELKEHMVGILFSREGLSDLQKQVVDHILQGLRAETSKFRDRSKKDSEFGTGDDYCFELMSMLLALSGSRVGQKCLGAKENLLVDVFCLLHMGSDRVQRQVVLLLKRIFASIEPSFLARSLGIADLPPTDYCGSFTSSDDELLSNTFTHRYGLLDGMLSSVAKGLQIRKRVRRGNQEGNIKSSKTEILNVNACLFEPAIDSSQLPPEELEHVQKTQECWLRGRTSPKIAKAIIQLLKDLSSGSLGSVWQDVTRAAVAEKICRMANQCLGSTVVFNALMNCNPSLCLAVAALCVLSSDHVERLSCSHSIRRLNHPDQPVDDETAMCDNHEDGCTLAVVRCTNCELFLCLDCDKVLHLPQRMRNHSRQIIRDDQEGMKVDLHEGCGRVKLSSLTMLADPATLQAMVEFRPGLEEKKVITGSSLTVSLKGSFCRFCGSQITSDLPERFDAPFDVCEDSECKAHADNACGKMLSCGHICCGIRNEALCLPCLNPSCVRLGRQGHARGVVGLGEEPLKQDGDDMCMVCFADALSSAPVIRLTECGHLFHLHCCQRVLEARWPGPRIAFGFRLCPICKTKMEHPALADLLEPIRTLFDDVQRKALMRLRYEGLDKCESITAPGGRFFDDPSGFAMDRYAYYVCFKCDKAYFGGEARCEVGAVTPDSYDPKELLCGACSDVSMAQMCPKHCTDYLEYKCRYCCSVAVFFCFGTTHFCNACHADFQRITAMSKEDLPHCPVGPGSIQLDDDECPLHTQHPPTGEEFALGCGEKGVVLHRSVRSNVVLCMLSLSLRESFSGSQSTMNSESTMPEDTTCDECGKYFNAKELLYDHMDLEHRVICPICGTRARDLTVACDNCEIWHHMECVGIHPMEAPAESDEWFCPKCRPSNVGRPEVKPPSKSPVKRKGKGSSRASSPGVAHRKSPANRNSSKKLIETKLGKTAVRNIREAKKNLREVFAGSYQCLLCPENSSGSLQTLKASEEHLEKLHWDLRFEDFDKLLAACENATQDMLNAQATVEVQESKDTLSEEHFNSLIEMDVEKKYHCKLCPPSSVLPTRKAAEMHLTNLHMSSQLFIASRWVCLPCFMDCGPPLHYHCPLCEKTGKSKEELLMHAEIHQEYRDAARELKVASPSKLRSPKKSPVTKNVDKKKKYPVMAGLNVQFNASKTSIIVDRLAEADPSALENFFNGIVKFSGGKYVCKLCPVPDDLNVAGSLPFLKRETALEHFLKAHFSQDTFVSHAAEHMRTKMSMEKPNETFPLTWNVSPMDSMMEKVPVAKQPVHKSVESRLTMAAPTGGIAYIWIVLSCGSNCADTKGQMHYNCPVCHIITVAEEAFRDHCLLHESSGKQGVATKQSSSIAKDELTESCLKLSTLITISNSMGNKLVHPLKDVLLKCKLCGFPPADKDSVLQHLSSSHLGDCICLDEQHLHPCNLFCVPGLFVTPAHFDCLLCPRLITCGDHEATRIASNCFMMHLDDVHGTCGSRVAANQNKFQIKNDLNVGPEKFLCVAVSTQNGTDIGFEELSVLLLPHGAFDDTRALHEFINLPMDFANEFEASAKDAFLLGAVCRFLDSHNQCVLCGRHNVKRADFVDHWKEVHLNNAVDVKVPGKRGFVLVVFAEQRIFRTSSVRFARQSLRQEKFSLVTWKSTRKRKITLV